MINTIYQVFYCTADWKECRDANVEINAIEVEKTSSKTFYSPIPLPFAPELLNLHTFYDYECNHWLDLPSGHVMYTFDLETAKKAYKEAFQMLEGDINRARFEFGSYINLLMHKKDLNFPVKHKKAFNEYDF